MARYQVEFLNGSFISTAAEYWDLDDGNWFDFYDAETGGTIVLTVNAREVRSITRHTDELAEPTEVEAAHVSFTMYPHLDPDARRD